MEVDEALSRLGRCGAWQTRGLILLAASSNFLLNWQTLIVIYVGNTPEYRCKLSNQTSGYGDSSGYEHDVDGCHVYSNVTNSTSACTSGWEYSDQYGPTIISEWDLVCKKSYLNEISQTLYMVALGISDFFITIIADYFGRKRAHIASAALTGTFAIAISFVDNYYAFLALRFLQGLTVDGVYCTGMVWLSEHYASDIRPVTTGISLFGWPTATCLLVLFAYLVPHWRHLYLVVGILSLFPILFVWLLDESIPWLCATKNFEQAEQILSKAGKANGKTGSWRLKRYVSTKDVRNNDDTMLLTSPEHEANNKQHDVSIISSLRSLRPDSKDDNIFDVLRHAKLRYYLIILALLWFINNWAYYGVVFGISSLGGSLHVNILLTAAVDAIASATIIVVSKLFGRLPVIIGGQLVVGIGLIISTFIPQTTANGTSLFPLITTIVMVALEGTAVAFATLCVYTPEVFPTPVRNLTYGIGMLSGRLGGIISPFYVHMGATIKWLPPVVVGGAAVLIGIATFTMPETAKRPLFQSIHEMDEWTKTKTKRRKKKENVPV